MISLFDDQLNQTRLGANLNTMRLFFLILSLLFSFSSFSTHLLGGELSFQCLGGGQYEFTLRIYHDCSPGVFIPSTEIIGGPQGGISLNLIATEAFLPDCYDTSKTGCGPNSAWWIERSTYKGTTSLSGPIPANGWEFGWSHCCRPVQSLRNLDAGSSGLYLYTMMYPDPTGSCSGSPRWGPVIPALNTGLYQMRNDALPPGSGDSLHYQLVNPMLSAGVSAVFSSGYSATAPFPDTNEDPSFGPVLLNSSTGSIVTDINTAMSAPKMFVYALKVENWRGGHLIATSYRDLPVILEPGLFADGNNQNNPPLAAIDTARWNLKSLPGQPLITANDILRPAVEVGDTLLFEMSAQDFDFNTMPGGGLVPQTILFMASGIALDTNRNSFQNYPVLKPKPPQSSFIRPANNQIIFSWIIDSTHLFGAATNYMFHFEFRDNACPVPQAATLDVEVIVLPAGNQVGEKESQMASFSVYPNPANDRISVNGLEKEVKAAILDITGRTLKTLTLWDTREIDVQFLEPGIYLLEIDGTLQKFQVK